MDFGFANPFIVAGFVIAVFTASFRVQFQALLYLLVCIFAVTDANQFILVTFFYITASIFHLVRAAAAK